MKLKHIPSVVAAGVVIAASSIANATNGYSPTGFGTTNKGLAGAGVALPQDSMAGATNPAGMVMLGNRADAGFALFNPNRQYTADNNAQTPPYPSVSPGTEESENQLFLVPHGGWNKQIDDKSSIGILLGGNGGMNTEYHTAVFQNFSNPAGTATSPTGVDLSQLFIGIPYARKLNDRNAIGIMPIIALQRFKAQGLEPFKAFSVNPDKVTNNGYDYSWGYGVRIGWLGQITDRLSLGASAQSRLYMQDLNDYSGLFADGGGFDIPPTVTAGLSFKVTPDVTVVADWQRIYYGSIKALANTGYEPIGPSNLLGSKNGLGFGWEDMDIFKLGVQWQYNPKLTFRAGVSHADAPFDGNEGLFNILAPATIRTHASLGMTYNINPGNAVSVAYTHAFNEKVNGQNQYFTGPQTGSLEMNQNELEVSWAWKFD